MPKGAWYWQRYADCTIDGCKEPASIQVFRLGKDGRRLCKHGLCSEHFQEWRMDADKLRTISIEELEWIPTSVFRYKQEATDGSE